MSTKDGKSASIAAILLLAWLSTLSAQPRRALAPVDILRVANVNDAQISPDGQWIVYTVSTITGSESTSTLWLARVGVDFAAPAITPLPSGPQRGRPVILSDGLGTRAAPTRLLPAGWNGSNPRWAPDSSKIAFSGSHDEQRGVWVVNLERREPRLVVSPQNTNFFITYAGESLAWAPDSKRIAYISATEEPSVARDPITGAQLDDPRVIDRLQYKSRTSFSDNRRTHVWITSIDRPEPRQLTSGAFYDHAITFSPDGNEIAFLSNREPDPDANNNSDIFAVDLHGEVRQITSTKGCEYEPVWSPDGKWIAYTATRRDVTTIDSVAEDTHVWVIAAGGGTGRELSGKLDRRARSPRWSSNSHRVLFLAGDAGQTILFGVDTASDDDVRPLFESYFSTRLPVSTLEPSGPRRGRLQVSSFSLTGRNQMSFIALTIAHSISPAELWLGRVALSDQRILQLSNHNDDLARNNLLSEPEIFTTRSFDGTPVQGWLMKPIGWREDRKYPLILTIHGGPHGMFGWAFNPTFQVYAGRGYAVLYLNPRGSSGYGQKFSDGTLNEWGGGDYKDLMAGVDEALRKYPWLDRDRMGVTGGSYGGFMTNWIITQTPRFKAAVAVASLSNLISFYSTSLYQDLIHAEFGGFPWDNYDLLWQWSPLRYVRQAQTPTMFLHGEQDNDVHITQAEEMYMALKRRGVDSVLIRYPREGHGLREPKHRVDALERTMAWFDRYLK
jgi:dipeptidyl aminopeptidase/acylaminoacyl peptidase